MKDQPQGVGGPSATAVDRDALRTFLEFAPDAVVIVEPDGKIAFVNAQTEKAFGYTRDELIGQPVEILLPERFRDVHGEHRFLYLSDPRTRPMGAGLALFGRRKDGSEFPVDISLGPLRTERGLLIAAAVRDITVRKKLEAVRDRFIADAAHELRTPLATLAGLGEMLALHMKEMTEEQIAGALEALQRQGRRASVLVANLLDLSQLETGRASISLGTVDLSRAVDRALEGAPPPAEMKVDVDVSEGISVLADPIRLEQVVTNLLTNAYRYGGAGIRVDALERGATVELTVADDGAGVPETIVPVLFEPFTRGPNAGNIGGSGIGLALSRRLIEAFGGTVGYQANEPHGSRFVVTLRAA